MPVRVAHFTDIHLTADPSSIAWRHLLSKRILGWINLRFLGRQASFRDARRVLSSFLEDLRALAPDRILFTGDLTALSLPEEFEMARAALGPLVESPRVIGIPGNHDVYVASAVKDRLYERRFGSWERTDLSAEDYPPDLRAFHPYPLVRFLDPGVVLIALRDVRPNAFHDSSGRVGREGLLLLEHVLSHPRVSPLTKIVALHCGFRRSGGRRERWLHGLKDAPALLEVCRKGRVSMLVHGHSHRRFVERLSRGLPGLLVANPGSLTSLGHGRAYSVYTVFPETVRIEARRLDGASGRFVAWPDAPGAGEYPLAR